VLDVQGLLQSDRVLILADGCGRHEHRLGLDTLPDLRLAEHRDALRDDQFGQINVNGQPALELDHRPFRRVHHLLVDHAQVRQAHFFPAMDRREFGCPFVGREEQGHDDDAVSPPFDLRSDDARVDVRLDLCQAGHDIVLFVELIDPDDLGRILKCVAADRVTGTRERCGHVIVAIVNADWREIIRLPFKYRTRPDAVAHLAWDPITISLGIKAAVDEESVFDRGEISADLNHLLHEQNGAFLQLAYILAERAIPVDRHHLAQAVHPDQCLPRRVDRRDIVGVPGHVPPLVRCDGRLDVGAGEPRDHHVQRVGDGGFAGLGLHVLRVLLGTHLVVREKVAQRDCIWQVQPHAGSWRSGRRYRRQGDIFRLDADFSGKCTVDRMLHHEFGTDLPGLHGSRVGIVGAIDLQYAAEGDDFLDLTSVDKAAQHVDVAIKDVVLRILVGSVNALLDEHHGNIGSGNAGYVGVQIDRPTDFFFDQVQCAAGGPDLFARYRDTADPLGRALDQGVDVRLAGGPDDHDVVSAIPGGHAHAADVVFEPAGGDLGRDHTVRLRIDPAESTAGRQWNRLFEGF